MTYTDIGAKTVSNKGQTKKSIASGYMLDYIKGILKTLDKGGGRKAAVLAFSQLLNIAEGHKAF